MEIKRDRYLQRLIRKMKTKNVKVVTGIRRCGKSYLLFNLFRQHLLSTGVPEDHIIAVDLDNDDSTELLDSKALSKYVKDRIVDDGKYFVLLDEIQMVDGFVRVVNGINSLPNTDVYVTGSNSRFLSSDIATEFRGRSSEIRVYPLSFQEFRSALEDEDKWECWELYTTYGGMPEVLNMDGDEDKAEYLARLMRDVYLLDIIEHYSPERTDDLGEILDTLFSSIGSLSNPKRVTDTLRTVKGSDIAYETTSRYIGMLEDAFILEKVSRYDVIGNRHLNSPFKYYATDLGLRNASLNYRQLDDPHIMENVIYNELRSRGLSVDAGSVEVWETSGGVRSHKTVEVDFVVNRRFDRIYIQSAYDMKTVEKESQELRPLLAIRDSFKKILIIGRDVAPYRNSDGILIMGIMNFLLDEKSLDL
ncbi:MAG: ATP-binding protein [Thermoplasmata archaeon]|nr:ATP-binding protein [Thermoplasmata archaeon]